MLRSFGTKHQFCGLKRTEIFMSKFTNPLNNIKIASPCSADWDEMVGDERSRFCGDCKLNVYNLSGMSRSEAENLIFQADENRLCVRFFRRADGTVLTKDCPVGWRAIRRNISKTATAFASLVFAFLGAIGLTNFFAKSNETQTMGTMGLVENSNRLVEEKPKMMMGNFAIQEKGEIEATVGVMLINNAPREIQKKKRR